MINLTADYTAGDLLPLVLDNNSEAFHLLRANLLKAARGIRAPVDLREDAVGMTMLNISSKPDLFLGADTASAYIYTTLRNNVATLLNKNPAEEQWDVGTAQNLKDYRSPPPSAGIEHLDDEQNIRQIIAQTMGDQQAAILIGIVLEGKSREEVAREVGRSEHHVRAILSRARTKLIDEMSERGVFL